MSNRHWVIISLILLLGAASRILHITEQSLWVDEGYAFYHAYSPDLLASLARDTHPPLYFAALRLWSALTGQSELALRWLSVLPSMLSLAVIFRLAAEVQRQRGINSNSPVPLLAMLMLALADAENYLAQEVRHYTWLVLLVLCSMWFLLRWIRQAQRADCLLWLLFTITMVHTHYITIFAAAAQALYALLALPAQRRRVIWGLVIGGAAFAPWLLAVGVQQLDNSGANWSLRLSAAVVNDIQIKYFTQQWALVIGLMLLGCTTVVYRTGARGWHYHFVLHRVSALLLLWLMVPLLLTLLANELLPFLQPRRLTQWTPVIALLLALGLGNCPPPLRTLLVGVLLVYGLFQVDFYRVKPDWRQVAQLTARYAVEGDLLLTDIAGGDYQMSYYLQQMTGERIRHESLKQQRDFHPATYHEWLPALLDAHQTVWLMHWSNDRAGFGWLEKLGFQQTADFVYWHDGGSAGEIAMHIFRFDRLAATEPLARFENGMLLRAAALDADDLRVDLLWQTQQPLARDYVLSAKLMDAAGQVAAQMDSQPQLNQRPTATWQIGELIYSPHAMQLSTPPLPAGEYEVWVQVYTVEAAGLVNVRTAAGAEYARVASLSASD